MANGNANRRRRKRRSGNFAVVYIVTMIVAVAVCVSLFAIGYEALIKDSPITGAIGGTPLPTPLAVAKEKGETVMGMITELDLYTEKRTLTLLLIDSTRHERFNFTNMTILRDRHGSLLGISEFSVGQIVDVEYDPKTNDIAVLSISPSAWVHQYRGNFFIDYENSAFIIGNDIYYYSSRTLVFNRGAQLAVSSIKDDDIITIIGYKDMIWCIRIDSGHGYVVFENTDNILNGTVTVSTVIFTALSSAEPIALLEGTHRIIVNGLNIETYQIDIQVRQGETRVVNLIGVEYKKAMLFIQINEPEASVYVDGALRGTDITYVDVEYGAHTIKVEKEGFITSYHETVVSQPYSTIVVTLIPERVYVSVTFESFPMAAEVFIDNVWKGTTPITIELEQGTYSVMAMKNGYEDASRTVNVGGSFPMTVTLYLQQQWFSPTPEPYLPPIPDDWEPLPSPTPLPDWLTFG
jgi:sporulation protein YlmC with PRC-barrel domain